MILRRRDSGSVFVAISLFKLRNFLMVLVTRTIRDCGGWLVIVVFTEGGTVVEVLFCIKNHLIRSPRRSTSSKPTSHPQ
jgi:hypothetical protein